MKIKQKDYASLAESHIYNDVTELIDRELAGCTSVGSELFLAMFRIVSRDWNYVEIPEWWTVSADFAIQAEKAYELIVETPFGIVWGRQTTGQPVYQDLNVQSFLDNL